MSESRKRSNEGISLSEENTESPADNGIKVDNNDDNVVIEVSIEDDQHIYHDDINNGENEDDDDEGEDDSNEDEDYEGDQHVYHNDNNDDEGRDSNVESDNYDYEYDTEKDEADSDEDEDDSDEDEDDSDEDEDDSDEDEDDSDDDDEGEQNNDDEGEQNNDDEGEHNNDVVKDVLALTSAMRGHETPNIIFLLAKAYIKAVQKEQTDVNDGELLLHLACSNYRSIVVNKFIELFPKSVQQIDEHGDYPLHIACTQQSDDVIMALIELFPIAVKHLNRDTYYPLQLALIYGRSERVVMKLLDVFPKAASHYVLTRSKIFKRKGDNGFALHMACRYVPSIKVIRKLAELNRMALRKKDCKGNYPLHCALYAPGTDLFMYSNEWFDVTDFLMAEDPFAIRRLNRKGESPFHLAYRVRNDDFIKFLIEDDDTLVNLRNRTGKTPLHYAAIYRDDDSSVEDKIIDTLLQNPSIDVNVNDNKKNTPLHSASMSNNLKFLRKLLDHRFVLFDQKNNENKTALDILKEKRKKIEERIAEGFESTRMEISWNDHLSKYLEIIQSLEELLVKQRWNAYLYHFNEIADL